MFTNFLCVFYMYFRYVKLRFSWQAYTTFQNTYLLIAQSANKLNFGVAYVTKKISSPGHFSLKCGMYHSGY